MLSNADLARLVMPLAIGLLIGLERGWQQRSAQPGSRVAGLRTFGLFGLIGGLAGFAAGMTQGWAVSAVLLLAGCALVIIGYRRDKSPSATTEAAALVTLGLGWLAGHDVPVPALALAVVTAFLLAQRARLHAWIEGLSEADFHAVVLFAVIAGALWPVLPDRAMGPMNAWNPRELWLVVVCVRSALPALCWVGGWGRSAACWRWRRWGRSTAARPSPPPWRSGSRQNLNHAHAWPPASPSHRR